MFMLEKTLLIQIEVTGVVLGTDRMAGRGQEEEECEDCKLQTILRVNVLNSLLWWRSLPCFCPQNIPLGTLSTSEQDIANQCFSGALASFLAPENCFSYCSSFVEVESSWQLPWCPLHIFPHQTRTIKVHTKHISL